MVTAVAIEASQQSTKTKGLFRRRTNGTNKKGDDKRDDIFDGNDDSSVASGASSEVAGIVINNDASNEALQARRNRVASHVQRSRSGVFKRTVNSAIDRSNSSGGQSENSSGADTHNTEHTPVKSNRTGRPNVFDRIRSASRSRSRTRTHEHTQDNKAVIVTVTSCRSDGYHNQKAPGSTSKLPRKAPANLKLFHELAVGLKDAFIAVGATPERPTAEDIGKLTPNRATPMTKTEFEGRMVIWEFVGNLDFVSFTSTETSR
jgi:hypothetical protein